MQAREFVALALLATTATAWAGMITPPIQRLQQTYAPEDTSELELPDYFETLDTAGSFVHHGAYRAALYLLWDKPADDAITMLRARAQAGLGDLEQALATVSQVKTPPARQLRIEILKKLNRADEAISDANAFVEAFPDEAAAHFALGQSLEANAQFDAAIDAYAWFVSDKGPLDRFQRRGVDGFDDAAALTLAAEGVDRWATLSSSYKDLPQLNNTVLSMFVSAYDKLDHDYWPAMFAEAKFQLSRDASDEAIGLLEQTLSINPRSLDVLELAGLVSVSRFDFDRVDQFAAMAEAVDPDNKLPELLATRSLLKQRRPDLARLRLAPVLERAPDDIEALSLLAAVEAIELNEAESNRLLTRIDELRPGTPIGYLEVAEQLGDRRQYERSAAAYKVAIDRAGWMTTARNGLGLLYTQSGQDDEARQTLELARLLDPYNLETTNYLRLLDMLLSFKTLETDHFIIRYDPANDPVSAQLFADELEQMHDEVVAQFGFEPPQKTIIEIYPLHSQFSVRTTGNPWIGTVGASTGPVIALVVPRDGFGTLGTYNWYQVVRHEYTHTVTLGMTRNRLAHWFTEGLAVQQENSPMRWEWAGLLTQAVNDGELFPIADLSWGFIRPRKPTDRSLAYAQAFWVCEFIQEKKGRQTLLDMLAAFEKGDSEPNVFKEVVGMNFDEFDRQFGEWAKVQVDQWHVGEEETADEVKQLAEEGQMLIGARDYEGAIERFKKLEKLRPLDPMPHARLAGLYLTKDIDDKASALERLKTLHAVALKDNRFGKRIASIYLDLGEAEEARPFAVDATRIDPYDADAHDLLAKVDDTIGNTSDAERHRAVAGEIRAWKAKREKERD